MPKQTTNPTWYLKPALSGEQPQVEITEYDNGVIVATWSWKRIDPPPTLREVAMARGVPFPEDTDALHDT